MAKGLKLPPLPAFPLGPMPRAARARLAEDFMIVKSIPGIMTYTEGQEYVNRVYVCVWAHLCFEMGFTPKDANYERKAKYAPVRDAFVKALGKLGLHTDALAVARWLAPPAARGALDLYVAAVTARDSAQALPLDYAAQGRV